MTETQYPNVFYRLLVLFGIPAAIVFVLSIPASPAQVTTFENPWHGVALFLFYCLAVPIISIFTWKAAAVVAAWVIWGMANSGVLGAITNTDAPSAWTFIVAAAGGMLSIIYVRWLIGSGDSYRHA